VGLHVIGIPHHHLHIAVVIPGNEEGDDVLVADRGKDGFVRPDLGAGRSGEGRDNDQSSYGKIQGVARKPEHRGISFYVLNTNVELRSLAPRLNFRCGTPRLETGSTLLAPSEQLLSALSFIEHCSCRKAKAYGRRD